MDLFTCSVTLSVIVVVCAMLFAMVFGQGWREANALIGRTKDNWLIDKVPLHKRHPNMWKVYLKLMWANVRLCYILIFAFCAILGFVYYSLK